MQDPIGAMGSIFNPQNYLPFLESDFEGDKPRFLKEDVEL
jgi:hypothetical protein